MLNPPIKSKEIARSEAGMTMKQRCTAYPVKKRCPLSRALL